MQTVNIYTDGACKGNPGPGGWAAVLINEQTNDRQEISGSESTTTNNRMELTAIIQSLLTLKQPSSVTITSDSSYVTNAVNQKWLQRWKQFGWKTSTNQKVKNVDLWKQLDNLIHIHEVKFIWTKGHSGHKENERCDHLARIAISELLKRTENHE